MDTWMRGFDVLMHRAPEMIVIALVLGFAVCCGVVLPSAVPQHQGVAEDLPSTELVPVRKVVLRDGDNRTVIVVYSDGKTTCYVGQGISSCSEVP